MHKTLAALAIAGATLSTACQQDTTSPTSQSAVSFGVGNNLPSGGHDFLLNIVGVSKDKTADMDGANGHVIFVQLNGGETVTNGGGKWKTGQSWADLDKVNKILLQVGDYQVLDANATDDDGALFQLPDPNPDDGSAPTYRVYARALGTPAGQATLTTCADETGAGFDGEDDVWCGSNGVTVGRDHGRPTAVEVTDNLLKMVVTVDPDLDPELSSCLGTENTDADDPAVQYDRWLFDPCFENYFWNYDNHGLKLLQLRFYAE